MSPNILAAINAALGLFKAGHEIFELVRGKEDITDEELEAIIAKQNAQQESARAALVDALRK